MVSTGAGHRTKIAGVKTYNLGLALHLPFRFLYLLLFDSSHAFLFVYLLKVNAQNNKQHLQFTEQCFIKAN